MDADYKEELIKLQLKLLQEKLGKESDRIQRMKVSAQNVGAVETENNSWMILQRLQRATEKQKELQEKIEKEYKKIKKLSSSSSQLLRSSAFSSQQASAAPVRQPPAQRENDRFDKYMEMMLINQTNAQNMIMNQLLLKSGESKNPAAQAYPPPQQMYPPFMMPFGYPPQMPQAPAPAPASAPQETFTSRPMGKQLLPEPEEKETLKLPKTNISSSHYPFPGNDSQRRLRHLGYAALFCSLLDRSAKENKFKPDNSFMFGVKVKEVINALHRLYLAESGAIAPILRTTLCSEEASSFKLLISTGANANAQVLKQVAQDVSYIVENLTYQISDILPTTGILGTHRKSGIYEMILNGQKYPDGYFFQIDLDNLQLDGERKTTNIGDEEALHIMINAFIIQGLVSTLLLKPREYGVVGDHGLKVAENIRVIATIYVFIYRRIISQLIANKNRVQKGQKITLLAEPRELSSFIYTDQEMDPVYKKVKKSIDYAEGIILQWARQYVARLRNASF